MIHAQAETDVGFFRVFSGSVPPPERRIIRSERERIIGQLRADTRDDPFELPHAEGSFRRAARLLRVPLARALKFCAARLAVLRPRALLGRFLRRGRL